MPKTLLLWGSKLKANICNKTVIRVRTAVRNQNHHIKPVLLSAPQIRGISSMKMTIRKVTVYGQVFLNEGPDMVMEETIINKTSQSKAIKAPTSCTP